MICCNGLLKGLAFDSSKSLSSVWILGFSFSGFSFNSKGRSTKVAFIDNEFLKSYIHQLVFAHYDYDIIEAEDLQFGLYEKGDAKTQL